MPCFSVITPVYNASQFITRSYYCLNAQSFSDWEWVIVDDGSTDDTVQRIAALSDARIRVIRYSPNRGRGYARSRALESARGEWVVIWDIDDLYFQDRLMQIHRARVEGYDFFCSYALLATEGLSLTGVRGFSRPSSGLPRSFMHPTLACELHLARSLGYLEALRTGEDGIMRFGLPAKYHGCFHEDFLTVYVEDRQMTATKATQANQDLRVCLQTLKAKRALHFTGWQWTRQMTLIQLKLSLLVLMNAVPGSYKWAIRTRAEGDIAGNSLVSPERIEFINRVKEMMGPICSVPNVNAMSSGAQVP